MIYTIKTDADNYIVSLQNWFKKYRTVFGNDGRPIGTEGYYEVPDDLLQISEKLYLEISVREDINYIKFVNGNVVEESAADKQIRMEREQLAREKNNIERLKEDLIRLSEYVVLTDKGNELING